jgi:hypothetical protein
MNDRPLNLLMKDNDWGGSGEVLTNEKCIVIVVLLAGSKSDLRIKIP